MGPNQAQSAAWNGPESAHYVDQADRYDRQLAPITDALLERAAITATDSVLDVACGSGASTLRVAPVARDVLGVDISEPLLDVARERAHRAAIGNAEFVTADAQIHDFDERRFDIVISQFGLMFFDDPVAAFTNIHRAMARGGRIVFTTWQGLGANEWLAPVAAALAAHTDVPDLGGIANGGGMFALRDETEIAELLAASGFAGVEIESLTPTVTVGGGGTLDETAEFLFGMGIVRGLLGRLDAAQHAQAVDDVREELARRHQHDVGVRLGAGVWLATARA